MPEIAEEEMQQACEWITASLPEGSTFIILAANQTRDNLGTLRYASNMERGSAVGCMKEWLIQRGYGEDWMEKIK